MTTRAPHPQEIEPLEPGTLTQRFPPLDIERLLKDQVPPPQFAEASFDSYRPDIAHPSQTAALRRMRALGHSLTQRSNRGLRGLFARKAATVGIYLDGGYGVGKTHLIAALAHHMGPQEATYGTFVEYTQLVGAIGFRATLDLLAGRRLVCIDEFELDDPGDTLIMSRLIRELGEAGVRIVATSNTQPGALGQGRFAAQDFKREIQALSDRFEILAIDGPDFRARTLNIDVPAPNEADVLTDVTATPGAVLEDFSGLVRHLSQVHPSRYGQLIDGVELLGLTGGGQITDDAAGLRLVVLIDRLYDRTIPVRLAGIEVDELFSERMRSGGYRKKYLRATSRLGALVQERVPHSAA